MKNYEKCSFIDKNWQKCLEITVCSVFLLHDSNIVKVISKI